MSDTESPQTRRRNYLGRLKYDRSNVKKNDVLYFIEDEFKIFRFIYVTIRAHQYLNNFIEHLKRSVQWWDTFKLEEPEFVRDLNEWKMSIVFLEDAGFKLLENLLKNVDVPEFQKLYIRSKLNELKDLAAKPPRVEPSGPGFSATKNNAASFTSFFICIFGLENEFRENKHWDFSAHFSTKIRDIIKQFADAKNKILEHEDLVGKVLPYFENSNKRIYDIFDKKIVPLRIFSDRVGVADLLIEQSGLDYIANDLILMDILSHIPETPETVARENLQHYSVTGAHRRPSFTTKRRDIILHQKVKSTVDKLGKQFSAKIWGDMSHIPRKLETRSAEEVYEPKDVLVQRPLNSRVRSLPASPNRDSFRTEKSKKSVSKQTKKAKKSLKSNNNNN